MKICYLILAHDNFVHLDRLISALDAGDASFYIHIDKKAEKQYISNQKNVVVIPQHFNIRWGGYQMIEASLSLMRQSKKEVPDADYYILLSGVDYPVRSQEFLYKLLGERREYIDILPMPAPAKSMDRFNHYYFEYDRRNIKLYNPKLLLEVLLKKLNIRRSIPFKLYAGTQWFALTGGCLGHILDVIEKDPCYVRFFRHSLIPDEAFFHTLIGNSPFIQNVATSLVYTDWKVPVPPAVIDERHINLIENQIRFEDEYGIRYPFFARKFKDQSADIIERIDSKLRCDKNASSILEHELKGL